jgi:hypothetical protein
MFAPFLSISIFKTCPLKIWENSLRFGNQDEKLLKYRGKYKENQELHAFFI